MTPSQMLKVLSKPVAAPQVWVPPKRDIVVPAGDLTSNQLLWLQHDEALRNSKCPTCRAEVWHTIISFESQQRIWFRCKKNPVFHDFWRPVSFLSEVT